MKNYLLNIGVDYKKILKNISYLSIYQLLNILIPLITIPYLLRVLGNEGYGLIIFGQVVVSYFAIIVNFGINNLAVGEVSLHQDNKFELNNIVSNIYLLKGFFLLISVILLLVLLLLFKQAKGNEALYILSLWVCLYEFLVPVWYFQGRGKLKTLMFLSLFGQIIFACLLFRFIKSPGDYLLLPFFNLINTLIVGFGCLIIIFKSHKLNFCYGGFNNLLQFSKKSWDFFISEIAIKIFAVSNKFIVGVSVGLTEVAYYDIIDKIINFFRVIPLNIARDSIYPIVSKSKNISLVRNTTIVMALYSIIVFFLIYAFSTDLIIFIGGINFLPSAKFLRFASILIFTTHISNYYITVGLWAFGYISLFKKLMIYSSILYVFIFLILWQLKIVNLYTLLIIPMIIDVYAILHYYFLYRQGFLVYNQKNS